MKKNRLFTEEFRNQVVELLHKQAAQPLNENQIAEKLMVRGGGRKPHAQNRGFIHEIDNRIDLDEFRGF